MRSAAASGPAQPPLQKPSGTGFSDQGLSVKGQLEGRGAGTQNEAGHGPAPGAGHRGGQRHTRGRGAPEDNQALTSRRRRVSSGSRPQCRSWTSECCAEFHTCSSDSRGLSQVLQRRATWGRRSPRARERAPAPREGTVPLLTLQGQPWLTSLSRWDPDGKATACIGCTNKAKSAAGGRRSHRDRRGALRNPVVSEGFFYCKQTDVARPFDLVYGAAGTAMEGQSPSAWRPLRWLQTTPAPAAPSP